MRHDPEIHCVTPWGEDPRSGNELLFPERFPEEAVEKLERDLGPVDASAQLGQRPIPRGGSIIEDAWIHYWSHEREPLACPTCALVHVLPLKGLDLLSVDCAFKDAETSDFVAMGALRHFQRKTYLVDLDNERRGLPSTCNALRAMASRWPRAHDKLIEDKANGPSVEQTLRGELQGITMVNPEGGKLARVNASAPAFAAGEVLLPHPAIHAWSNVAKHQITKFPRVKNDDIVDMMTQAILRLRRHGASFSLAMAKLRGETR
jgi:predicted phage terminase large subunit-like protein